MVLCNDGLGVLSCNGLNNCGSLNRLCGMFLMLNSGNFSMFNVGMLRLSNSMAILDFDFNLNMFRLSNCILDFSFDLSYFWLHLFFQIDLWNFRY